jgi:uncharacterized protein YkwD
MQGNYIDLIVIFYFFACFISGLRKGPSYALSDVLSLLAAIFLSLATFGMTAGFLENNFQLNSAYANAAGFFLNAFIIKNVLLFTLDHIFKGEQAGKIFTKGGEFVHRFLGGIFALLYGFLVATVFFSLVFSLSLPASVRQQFDQSRFGSFAEKDYLKINNGFKEVFGQLYQAVQKDFGSMDVKTRPEEKMDLGFKDPQVSVDSGMEEKMLEMVNKERTSRGLKALAMDEEARRAARDYGQYLFKNGIFSHTDLEGGTPKDRMKKYSTEFVIIGENLAYAHGLEEAHEGLMQSKGHRENILHPLFSRVGIGVVNAGDYGIIFVQEFLS